MVARLDSENGSILARCDLENTFGKLSKSNCIVDAELVTSKTEIDLVLTFQGTVNDQDLFIDAFQFIDVQQ